MKLILLLILPLLTIAQSTNERKIYLLNKKVELTIPAQLVEMSDRNWNLKYEGRPRQALALADKRGEVSLIGMITKQRAKDSQISAYKDFQIAELKKVHPDIQLIDQGVKTVRGKKVGYFRFLSQAIDQKIFNYYFFTVVDGEVVLFNFNSIEKLRSSWENKAEQIVSSLIVN
ncbi:hypothetical protein [Rubrolithibacter danxiaensis]|uniref:hypothetical protein n=1 Tax=Rubrolithibacter danxiaensis TaxID=3390805 RepID=UPI003BF92723